MLTALTTPGPSEPTGRFALRQATRAAHEALEATPVMVALMGARPSVGTITAALSAHFQVYAAVEAMLLSSRPFALACHPGYRPRAPLAAADLARVGADLPPGPQPISPPAFASDPSWWGWFYVVDGASLGGAVITRRLAETAPELPRLTVFDPYGEQRGAVWRAVCHHLDAACQDPATAAAVTEGAVTAFGLFADALGAAPAWTRQ